MLVSVSWYKGLAHVVIISRIFRMRGNPYLLFCQFVWVNNCVKNLWTSHLNYSNVIFLSSLVECFLGSIWSVCSCSSDLHHSLCKGLKAFSPDKNDQWKRRPSRWGVNPVSTMNCLFPRSKTFHFQNEAYCKSFLINMSFYIAIHENKNWFSCQ